MKIYRAHVGGFFETFTSLDALRTWVNDLNARHNLKGEVLSIIQGVRYGNNGDQVDVLSGAARQIVIEN